MSNSICIPVYDRPDYLQKTLEGILQYCEKPYEIVLVADCPKDPNVIPTIEKFKKEKFPELKLIVNPENYREPKSQCIAMKNASGNVLIHLEGDIIIPTYGWNKKFEDFLIKYEEVGLIGLLSSIRGDVLKRPEYYEAQWIVGGCMSLRKEVFEEVGGMDENLLHQIEPDWALRIRMAGYRITVHPEIPNWIHLGENDYLETDNRQALMNIGVHNFLKKWNKRFMGFLKYSRTTTTMSWDDFPINEFFRRMCLCGKKLNRNPQKVVLPREPDCKENGWGQWDLIYHTRPINRECEEELESEVRENKIYNDGNPLEERMKGRSFENLCKKQEKEFNWIYVDNETLKKLKELKIKFGQ